MSAAGTCLMFRFSFRQFLLLVAGLGLIIGSVFYDPLMARWEKYRYPGAVHWQGMRVVPGHTQSIELVGGALLVIKDALHPRATLTFFLRNDDRESPAKLIRSLCTRDDCRRASFEENREERAAANYRINGEAMQILLARLPGGRIWLEYKGPPDALLQFSNLIDSVTRQLMLRGSRG